MTEGDSIRMRRSPSVAGLLNAPAIEVWRVTGEKRAASTGATIGIDRAEIWTN
jgi:hypothetical protein